MIVSDDPRFICFQPWKVASSTLYARLQEFDSGRYPQGRYFNEHLGKWAHKHMALDDFANLPEFNQSYFRFCFVRNPYDRIFSGYKQRKARLTQDREYRESAEKHQRELRAIEGGFKAFLKRFARRFEKDGRPGKTLHDHLYHDGSPMLDYVGFIEFFECCLASVLSRIGVESESQSNANVRSEQDFLKTPASAATARYRYITRFDAECIDIVNTLYPLDFEILGYRKLDPAMMEQNPDSVIQASPFERDLADIASGAPWACRGAAHEHEGARDAAS